MCGYCVLRFVKRQEAIPRVIVSAFQAVYSTETTELL